MIHEITISTPANTPSYAKQITHWPLELGVIEELFIYFPPGCMGYNSLQILYHGSQVFPKFSGQFRGNDVLFPFRGVSLGLFAQPLEFICYTWNTSPLFSHSVDIYVNISPMWRFLA